MGLQIEFNSASVAVSRRLRYWQDLVGDHLADVDMRQPKQVSRSESYIGSMSLLVNPSVTFAKVRSANQLLCRTSARVRRSEKETLLLNIMMSGECHVEQEGRRALLRPGDLCIYESVRPYEITTPGEFEVLVVMVDRSIAEAAFGNLRIFTGRSIEHPSPTTAIAVQYWHNLAKLADRLDDTELKSLVTTGFDVLKTAFGSVPFPDRERTAAAALSLQRAKTFMKENFWRPTLSGPEIAQATGLSLRRLQELFQGEGMPIMAYLQNLRLEAARRYLADQTLARMPVASIMERTGFTDQSHFSRIFHRACGQSPRAWRRTHGEPKSQ